MSKLNELDDIYKIGSISHEFLRFEELARVDSPVGTFPIHGFSIGTQKPEAPVLAVFGGVHGLERVGTHVAISFLHHVVERLAWDKDFVRFLEEVRIVSIPLLNPGGMAMLRRANPNGVDLMRNAPTDAIGVKKWQLYSGQSISSKLSWYRGEEGKLEKENQVLLDFMYKEVLTSNFAMSVDIHSGFGTKDRLWYPYARSSELFPYRNIVDNFEESLNRSQPYHIYNIEKQSDSYLIHGDIWDYIFDLHYEAEDRGEKVFIPWTLELGSWLWVKKNPMQLFSVLGMFNPVEQHRFNRIMRRHIMLLSHFYRVVNNSEVLKTREGI